MSNDGFDDLTVKFRVNNDKAEKNRKILKQVYTALGEKGYDPVSQIVGYLVSGDPTYITHHKEARNLMKKLERDELIEEMVCNFLDL